MPKRGTSSFTHIDDAVAPTHTSHPGHFDALHYGEEHEDVRDREQVVLGPPAFGSPDPRTLGHTMHPDMRSHSAPSLDPDFHAIQRTPMIRVIMEDELNEMSKAELYGLAKEAGLDVNKKMSKDELTQKIVDQSQQRSGQTPDDEDEDEEFGEDEDENESVDYSTGASTSVSGGSTSQQTNFPNQP